MIGIHFMLKRIIAATLLFTTYLSDAQTVLTSGSIAILTDIQLRIKGLDPEQRVNLITEKFLGTPYNDNTLNSMALAQENLIVNLKSMDCMTFIEYTEALKRSDNYDDFINNLKAIRYSEENMSYANRRHFFTDWLQKTDGTIVDITAVISANSVQVSKNLNLKSDGQRLIKSLPVTKRIIRYIPMEDIDKTVLNAIQTGDYIGIYSNKAELDVSHVGIAIRQDGKVYLRNASSLKRHFKVSDTELNRYLQGKTGIIVLRSYYDKLNG